MYLFDTDIITNIFKKNPSQPLLKKLAATPHSQQFISTITISEIVYGLTIAIANEMTLVSGNIKHFSRVTGLPLENWLY